MARNSELKIITVKDILDDIRKPNGDKRHNKADNEKNLATFDKIVCNNWAQLGLGGAPNPRLFERLLIGSIEDIYQDRIQRKNRVGSRRRDVVLVSFGLLKGYSYHTENDANTWLEDRYENYLNNSDFAALQSSEQGGYQRIKKYCPFEKKKLLELLMHDVYESKKEISKKILEKIENKTYNEYLDANDNVIEFELPTPCYTLNNFEPIKKSSGCTEEEINFKEFDSVQKNEEAQEAINTCKDKDGTMDTLEDACSHVWVQPDAPIFPLHLSVAKLFQERKEKISLKFLLKVACIVFIILAPILTVCVMQFSKTSNKAIEIALKETEKITPDLIEISNKNIFLFPGEEDDLEIKTEPKVELNELSYRSTDNDIVKPRSLHSPHILASENATGEAEIIVHGEGAAQDTATVIIKDPANRTSLRETN